MSDIAKYTRLPPSERIGRLQAFNRRLQDAEKKDSKGQSMTSKENFKEWNFELEKNLVELSGRRLKNEDILCKGKT